MSDFENVFDLLETNRPQSPPDSLPVTKSEQAEFVAQRLKGKALWIAEWNKWIFWNGNCWLYDHGNAITQGLTRDALKSCYELLSDASFDEKSFEFKLNDFRKMGADEWDKIIRTTHSVESVRESHEALGLNKNILPVGNGTIDLQNGLLRQSSPDDLMLNSAPVNFDAGASCPLWDSFLEQVLPDSDVRDFFQAMFGYCLTGEVKAQKFFYLYGEGANGKSTALDIMQALLGGYLTQGNPSLIVQGKDEHATAVADLHGKRVAAFNEVAEGAKLNESSVKSLTGGDVIKARRMREDFWQFEPTHKVIISGNHKLSVSGSDNAIWRRPVLIHFPVQIPQEKRDPHLTQKLKKELSGILNWAVVGACKYYREGLKVPQVLEEQTASYREQSDWCQEVIDEEFKIDESLDIDCALIMSRFKNYFDRHSEKPKSSMAIYAALERKGFYKIKKRGRRYIRGLTTRSEELNEFSNY